MYQSDHNSPVNAMTAKSASAMTQRGSGEKERASEEIGVSQVLPGAEPRREVRRNLKARHIQLIGIGGTIGTALFVQIGKALLDGGPGSLFIAYAFWSTFILALTNCVSEMVTYLPMPSPIVHLASRFVDDAFGFAAGYNFFIFQAFLVPFEIVACTLVINFWTDKVPAGVIIAIILVLYIFINFLAVQYYGESEFWLALGKLLLIVGLLIFTFVSMLGGNPENDRYGFRYWKDPGSFAEYYTVGSTGKFLGFVQCLVQAGFTIAGPDYVSMTAGEAENPRKILPRAYKATIYRLVIFFILGSLAVGINVPYTDSDLKEAFDSGAVGAAASPYVVAMRRLRIPVLPHIVNAMIFSSCFSAGNSYMFCASRTLYGLGLEKKAPKLLTKCTKNGVPIYCVGVVAAIALLAFLQLGSSAAVVLQWFVNLVTASQVMNFAVMAFTYIRFKKALATQGVSRDSLPYKTIWQPFCAYYCLCGVIVMALINGYGVFLKGEWDTASFLFSYTMVGAFPLLYILWKLFRRSTWVKAHNADLYTNLDELSDYDRWYQPPTKTSISSKILDALFA